jgi:hypothetical protein
VCALEIIEHAIAAEEALEQVLPALLTLEHVAKEAVLVAESLRVALEGAKAEDQSIERRVLPRSIVHQGASAVFNVLHALNMQHVPRGGVLLVSKDTMGGTLYRNLEAYGNSATHERESYLLR